MSRDLTCNSCKKHMATLRDASVRKGIVVYCDSCDPMTPAAAASTPDFISTLFGGKLR